MRKSLLLWMGTCVLSASVFATGCLERPGAPVGPNVTYGQDVRIGAYGVSAVDVLFVIDNSGSMSQEQDNLAEQIPSLVRGLASPPDRDGDGEPDWNAVEELRIGIATTDVGIGSISVLNSHCVPEGDDGALRGGVFEWRTGQDLDAFAAGVRASVQGLGLEGCAFEQPLEAAARAVARAPETGFPRADGLFALIVVTDEEDCSVEDDDGFFGAMDGALYNVHCARNEDQLTPVETLLEQIAGGRAEEEFLYAAIAGIPTDVPADVSPDTLLGREDMQHRESSSPLAPIAVCEAHDASGESLGLANPARRLVHFAALVPDPVLTTVCTDDFGPAVTEIASRFGARIPGVCLVRELSGTTPGAIPCDVSVSLPDAGRCSDYGYADLGVDAEGQTLCAIEQVADASGSGWYYDGSSETCPQLVITDDVQPPVGAVLRAECSFSIYLPLGELCARSSQCESGYCDPTSDLCAPLPGSPGGITGG